MNPEKGNVKLLSFVLDSKTLDSPVVEVSRRLARECLPAEEATETRETALPADNLLCPAP